MLVPEPDRGRWAALPAEQGSGPLSELVWREPPVGVVVAEDAAIIRAGIVSLLRADGMEIRGEAADFDAVLATVRRTRPQLLITDIRMPPGQDDEGLRAAQILRAEQPDLCVLVLSQHIQASAAALLLDGQTSGIGYLLKERVTALDEFLSAARTVAGGGTVIDPLITREMLNRRTTVNQLGALAERETDVLDLMAQGLSNAAIAERLSLSTRTVESHVRSIMTKLDLWEDPAGNRRVQAVIRWLDQQ
jgi:DNA-binding NarL/FixJ family response regulator